MKLILTSFLLCAVVAVVPLIKREQLEERQRPANEPSVAIGRKDGDSLLGAKQSGINSSGQSFDRDKQTVPATESRVSLEDLTLPEKATADLRDSIGPRLDPDNPETWPQTGAGDTGSIGERIDPDDPGNWPNQSAEASTVSIGLRLDPNDPATWPGATSVSSESIGPRIDPDKDYLSTEPSIGSKESIGERVDPGDPAGW